MSEGIAVVGIGCRFPPACIGAEQYWEFLMSGGDAVGDIPDDRWHWPAFYDTDPVKPAKMPVHRGAFLEQPLEAFDAAFFGIAPVEAAQLDPQQRLLLEVAWETLEDTGQNVWRFRGSRTGVYVGAFTLDNLIQRSQPDAREDIGPQTAMTCTPTVLSSRLAYTFDLHGPCMTIDTACSSSLVAIHQACVALRAGECDLALAGGVNRIFRPETYLLMSKGNFLAPDGRSKSFSRNADGYGRGEGCGLVALKRLEDARLDGDRIYAVVAASGVNQDGRTAGMALPSVAAQSSLIGEVGKLASVPAAHVAYVEAHGTGTAVGDPCEMHALGESVGPSGKRAAPCVVGSVKAGIGHLEGAAGVAGFIKTALVAQRGIVPPQAWLDELNPTIDFDGLGLRVASEAVDLRRNRDSTPLIVAVNSFGYGGTNAHAILCEPPSASAERDRPEHAERRLPRRSFYPPLVLVSGHTDGAVAAMARGYADRLREVEGEEGRRALLASFAARTPHEHRCAVLGGPDDFVGLLETVAEGKAHPDLVTAAISRHEARQPVFVFSGMGPQWWAMGRDLLHHHDGFRIHAERCDELFRRQAGWSVLDVMLADEGSSQMTDTAVAQPAGFVLQTGLVAVLAELGVRPTAVVGHSIGEVAAAYTAGSLDLADALTVVHHRSRLQATTEGHGSMLATDLPATEAQDLVQRHGDRVSVAAVNGPTATTLAGDADLLDQIEAELHDRDRFCRRLRVQVAYHSPTMDPILDELRQSLRAVNPSLPSLPLYSTVSAEDDNRAWDADYWVRNVRQPVAFHQAVERAAIDDRRVFVEIGPHPVLAMYLQQIVGTGNPGAVVTTLHRDHPDAEAVIRCAASLWVSGIEVDWSAVVGSSVAGSLPPYTFQRTSLWQEGSAQRLRRTGVGDGHDRLYGVPYDGMPGHRELEISPSSLPWCRDHVLDGEPVFPAAGWVELLVSLATQTAAHLPVVVENMAIETPLVLAAHADTVVRSVADDDGRVVVSFRHRGDRDNWQRCVTARVGRSRYSMLGQLQPLHDPKPIDVAKFYSTFSNLGLDYRHDFRCITGLVRSDAGVDLEVDASISTRDGHQTITDPNSSSVDSRPVPGYTLYPPWLDAALQGALALQPLDAARLYLPVRLRRLVVHGELPARFAARIRAADVNPDRLTLDIDLLGHGGELVAALRGVELVTAPRPATLADQWLDNLSYRSVWRAVDQPEPRAGTPPRKWLLVGPDSEPLAAQLAENGLQTVGAPELADWLTVAEESLEQADAIVVHLGEADMGLAFEQLEASVAMVQRVLRLTADRRPRELVLVARGSQPVRPDDRVSGWASAWSSGLCRVLAAELEELRVRFVDLDSCADDPATLKRLADLLVNSDLTEAAVRRGEVFVLTIDRVDQRSRSAAWWDSTPTRHPESSESYALSRTGPSITDLSWVATRRRAPCPGEVELRVEAVGLNYKDVLKLVGAFTPEMATRTFIGDHLGMEQCAVVERVGDGIQGLRPGDRVLASIPGGFRRHVTLPLDRMRLVPMADRRWTCVEAAGQLVALATAHRTLVELAGLAEGETVLVHSASGAVGMAACNVARARGARVVGTAGTEAKRALIAEHGVVEAYDSRSLDFVGQVRAATAGHGADVILNTLPGADAMRANLELLADGGRLVEIGKSEIARRGSLPLELMDRNVSFIAFDLDQLARDEAAFRALASRVQERLAAGDYSPVPVTRFAAANVAEAYRQLAHADHTGKLVVDLADTAELSCATALPRGAAVRPDRSYLITGGTGGLGVEIARWLVGRGATRLALLSRSGRLDERGRDVVAELQTRHVDITVAAVDVTCIDDLVAFLDGWTMDPRPLAGIVHAAGTVHDGRVETLSPEDASMVLKPKFQGALALHEATRHHGIDFFLLTSSVSGWLGTTGQSAYAAANATLDAFAQWRRRQGLAASSIALGPVADVGMAALADEIRDYVQLLGFAPLPLDRLPAVLDRALEWDWPQLGLFDVNWLRWGLAEPRVAMSGRCADLVERARRDQDLGSSALRAKLEQLDAGERADALSRLLVTALAAVTGIDPDAIEVDTPIDGLGLDSLMMVEIQTQLNKELGTEVTLLGLLSRNSLTDIAKSLAHTL